MKEALMCILVLCTFCAEAEENDPELYPWVVFGRVTDANGEGLADVTVSASCGRGSLMPTGSTMTDAEGTYRLAFGPGKVVMNESGQVDLAKTIQQTVLQAAIIAPRHPGYFEQNLRRQGDLRMGRKLPKPSDRGRVPSEKIVLPNKPMRVDFVLLPAASIRGRVVDRNGNPVTSQRFYVDGTELVPGASVLQEFRPNDKGMFSIPEVPCKSFWFSPVDGDLSHLKSKNLAFRTAGPYEVVVVFDRGGRALVAEIIADPGDSDVKPARGASQERAPQ